MDETRSQTDMLEDSSPNETRSVPRGAVRQPHESVSLLVEMEPWHQAFFRQIKETIRPPKLPPLQLTSKPVAVKDIWSSSRHNRLATETSVLLHVIGVAAFVIFPILFGRQVVDAVKRTVVYVPELSPYDVLLPPAADKAGGGGGGGDRSPEPPPEGKLPKLAMEQKAPPTVIIRNPEPELPVEPTVIIPPQITLPNVNLAQLGDPLGIVDIPSNGPGFGGGIGTGSGGGVGSGRGGGVGPGEGGGIGGGVFRVGGGVSAPEVIFKVEPEYSEQARKSKYQGTVLLSAVVQRDGSIRDIRIVQSLGLGLDEKAMEAVKQWRFRPGMKGGQPVDVSVVFEVNFRLL
jgi:TonB family protein